MGSAPGDVTQLLSEIQNGNPQAASQLMDFVYAELRKLASSYLRRERLGHTLQPTALVHEAFLRLIGDQPVTWRDRSHFFGIAARVMRQILVDYARSRNSQKRGGRMSRVKCDDDLCDSAGDEITAVLDLDRALERLQAMDPRLGRIVELRYFGGLSIEEVAEVMDVSPRTVKRDWTIAKAWLKSEISGGSRRAAGRLGEG